MLVLGLLLILVAAGLAVVAVLGASTTPVDFALGGFALSMEPLWVFLSGAATVLLLVLGLELLRAGTRRANKRRKEKKELKRLAREAQVREAETRETRAAEAGTTATAAPDASAGAEGAHGTRGETEAAGAPTAADEAARPTDTRRMPSDQVRDRDRPSS